MKTLEVSKLEFDKAYPDIDIVSKNLDSQKKRNRIDQLNWKGFDYKPEVEFSIGYSDNGIMLKYYITENYFKAEKTESNQMVCEDSCVEFFTSPGNDGIYYNFEFNGIGTCLLGTGTSRENNLKADPRIIEGIRRKTSMGKEPVSERKGEFTWTITVGIPLNIFFHHKITALRGRSFRANFYKCGDKLSVPHFITWSPVRTPKPDFHRPDYFGMIKFI
jgi:hypothetical protein